MLSPSISVLGSPVTSGSGCWGRGCTRRLVHCALHTYCGEGPPCTLRPHWFPTRLAVQKAHEELLVGTADLGVGEKRKRLWLQQQQPSGESPHPTWRNHLCPSGPLLVATLEGLCSGPPLLSAVLCASVGKTWLKPTPPPPLGNLKISVFQKCFPTPNRTQSICQIIARQEYGQGLTGVLPSSLCQNPREALH